MPTVNETIPQRALSGGELKRLLIDDFMRLINNHSQLTDYIAYGRITYVINLDLHVDRPFGTGDRTEATSVASKPFGKNLTEGEKAPMPELAAVETPPMVQPSSMAEKLVQKLTRVVSSPNAERLRLGMPVPVEVRQRDGSVRVEEVKYPGTGEPGDVTIEES
jgi:hypothetical protein